MPFSPLVDGTCTCGRHRCWRLCRARIDRNKPLATPHPPPFGRSRSSRAIPAATDAARVHQALPSSAPPTSVRPAVEHETMIGLPLPTPASQPTADHAPAVLLLRVHRAPSMRARRMPARSGERPGSGTPTGSATRAGSGASPHPHVAPAASATPARAALRRRVRAPDVWATVVPAPFPAPPRAAVRGTSSPWRPCTPTLAARRPAGRPLP